MIFFFKFTLRLNCFFFKKAFKYESTPIKKRLLIKPKVKVKEIVLNSILNCSREVLFTSGDFTTVKSFFLFGILLTFSKLLKEFYLILQPIISISIK